MYRESFEGGAGEEVCVANVEDFPNVVGVGDGVYVIKVENACDVVETGFRICCFRGCGC